MGFWIIPKQKSPEPDLRAVAIDHQARSATKRLRAQIKKRLEFEQSAQFKARLIAEQEARASIEQKRVEEIERSKEEKLKRIDLAEQAQLKAEKLDERELNQRRETG